jgi:flagellar biosynthesis protein FlhG
MGLSQMRLTKSISVTSGKGGVGKSTLISNIAQELSLQGKKVLLFDGDVGMGNLHILFGATADKNIIDVVKGESSIDEVVTRVLPGVDLIPGGSGLVEINHFNAYERRNLLDAMDRVAQRYDYLLVDTAPGISEHVLYLNASVDQPVVVITPDPSSFADAYALIKVLNQIHKVKKFSILCNFTRDQSEGLLLYKRFSEVVHRFLNVSIDYLGAVPFENALRKAGLHRRLIMRDQSADSVAQNIREISVQLLDERTVVNQSKGLQLLWSQVVGLA